MDKRPLNWCKCNLKEIFSTASGGTPSRKKASYYNGQIPWLKSGELNDNIVKKAEEFITKEGLDNSSAKIFPKGSILLALYGATVGKIGKLDFEAATNQAICCIYPSKFFNMNLLFYYLLFQKKFLISQGKGGAQPNISQDIVKNLELFLPPLEEQGRIVEKIEELFSDIDNGIEDLKIAQAQIKQYRQSVLKSAFEGKLYKTSEWKEVDIKKIISREKNALKAGPFGSALKKEIYVANGYKIYGQEQVISQNPFLGNYYINEEKYQQLISCSVKPLDILISLVGTIGKVLILPKGIEKGIINPRLIKVTLDVDQYLPAFFKLYFESQYLRSLFKTKAHGATMDVLNLSILKEIPFPLPTIPEQQQIVAEIEKRFAVADEMEKAVNDSLLQAEKLKQSILKQAFAGKLVPQNHNDEPAAVLLERIKAAKENSTKGKNK